MADVILDELDAVAALDGEVVLAGVRHHSPACAQAVDALIADLCPTQVLIEGPHHFMDMASLQDPDLCAPVALFSYVAYPAAVGPPGIAGRQRLAGWYPMCDYSPELVAVQAAGKRGIPVAFCDLGLHERLSVQQGLAGRLSGAERDLFEAPVVLNVFQQRVMERIGARDEDDLWDLLFEANPRSHAIFLRDIAAYGAALRAASPPASIQTSGDTAREAFMADAARKALAQNGGPVVLVCGAFHLVGIAHALREDIPPPEIQPPPKNTLRGVHLVPYTFQRMRRLTYAAGVPQPAWYQAAWEDLRASKAPTHPAWLRMLFEAARYARERGEVAVSTAELEGAAEMARRLAGFRGHRTPSRTDVLDAAGAAWVKGARDGGHGRVLTLIDAAFSGQRSGRVGPQSGDPALVQDVDRQLKDLSLTAPSGRTRDVKLRPVRAQRDRMRSRALSRLAYLDVAYAALVRGPDLVRGTNLDRVEQQWTIGWTTESRSTLFERASYGATLEDAAAERLREQLSRSPPRADAAVKHLIEACAMGLQPLLQPLLSMIADRIEADNQLASALRSMHGLVLLYRYRDALDAVGLDPLEGLIRRNGERALLLLSTLPDTPAEREGEAIEGLTALEHAAAILGELVDAAAFYAALEQIRPRLLAVPGVAGAADGVLWRAERLPLLRLQAEIRARFAEDPESPGRYLGGLLALVRRAYLDNTRLIVAVGEGVASLEESDFRQALPRLRREHAALTPSETSRLSHRVETIWGEGRRSRRALPMDAGGMARLQMVAAQASAALAGWGLAPAPAPAPAPTQPTRRWPGP
ncbi:MAG: DUF5682 family protein, partial [Myxococcota bacterium]